MPLRAAAAPPKATTDCGGSCGCSCGCGCICGRSRGRGCGRCDGAHSRCSPGGAACRRRDRGHHPADHRRLRGCHALDGTGGSWHGIGGTSHLGVALARRGSRWRRRVGPLRAEREHRVAAEDGQSAAGEGQGPADTRGEDSLPRPPVRGAPGLGGVRPGLPRLLPQHGGRDQAALLGRLGAARGDHPGPHERDRVLQAPSA
mmetsp:Transcript_72415/g.219171  ORF Transcript_72415/g.219171 Transcript_72415/m.219171 type:complete len:202 (-) Transcript_72415:272-877(-)